MSTAPVNPSPRSTDEPFYTTGVKGSLTSRIELHELLKDKDLTNIYLLAVDEVMKRDQKEVNSWFQLGAIHGRPYMPYNGVGQDGTFLGYCCHSSTLFPPWHRPYLALLEQVLGDAAKEIAYKYTNPAERERYVNAANKLRLPYWDWAVEAPLPDIVAREEKVKVYVPPGKEVEIDNPLFGYKFHPVYDDFGDGLKNEKTWETWERTLRYPPTTEETNPTADDTSRPDSMQNVLRNNQYTLRDRVYNLLSQVTKWDKFSHDAAGGIDVGTDGLDSIESIHNAMHWLGGGDGHMGEVDFAAFDPIFWLHHANVDRLFALWQALYPNEYVTTLASQNGTFTRFPGEPEDTTSLLTPFRKFDSKNPHAFWTAQEVRDTRVFNYTYPELKDLYGLSAEDARKRLCRRVNELYGKTAPVSAVKPSVFDGLKPVESKTKDSVNNKTPKWQSKREDQPHYHDWFVNIQVEKYSVGQSFVIHVFLGDVPSDPTTWGTSSNLVGSHSIFATRINTTGCGRCKTANQQRLMVGGSVPLTHALANHFGSVSDLEPDAVVPYLKQNLNIRLQLNNGKVVDTKAVPSLKVVTGNTFVSVPKTSEEFPVVQKVDLNHRHH